MNNLPCNAWNPVFQTLSGSFQWIQSSHVPILFKRELNRALKTKKLLKLHTKIFQLGNFNIIF